MDSEEIQAEVEALLDELYPNGLPASITDELIADLAMTELKKEKGCYTSVTM
jgi:hypothetical protein